MSVDKALLYQVKVYVNVLGTKREFNADISLIRNKRVAGVLIYSVYDRSTVPVNRPSWQSSSGAWNRPKRSLRSYRGAAGPRYNPVQWSTRKRRLRR